MLRHLKTRSEKIDFISMLQFGEFSLKEIDFRNNAYLCVLFHTDSSEYCYEINSAFPLPCVGVRKYFCLKI